MEWGRFLKTMGSIFATVGLTVLLVLKYGLDVAVPSFVTDMAFLGLGVVLLGALVIYAIPDEKRT